MSTFIAQAAPLPKTIGACNFATLPAGIFTGAFVTELAFDHLTAVLDDLEFK
jgi:hypothetical protein